jgi:hypothetical protein
MLNEILINFYFSAKTLTMTSSRQLKLTGKLGNIINLLSISATVVGQSSEICKYMKTEFLASFL